MNSNSGLPTPPFHGNSLNVTFPTKGSSVGETSLHTCDKFWPGPKQILELALVTLPLFKIFLKFI